MKKGIGTKSICKKKLCNELVGSVCVGAMLLFAIFGNKVPLQTAEYYSQSLATDNTVKKDIRTINLGVDSISAPQNVSSINSNWSNGAGSYIYYGNYYQDNNVNKTPIKWRVLSTKSDSTGNTSGAPNSILLMSDKVLDNIIFNSNIKDHNNNVYKVTNGNITGILANNYSYSDIRYWLNSDDNGYAVNQLINDGTGFLKTAFTQNEINGINETSKDSSIVGNVLDVGLNKDKVFLLSSFEMNNPLYGFAYSDDYVEYNISKRFEYTEYVKTKGILNTQNAYQLRTVDNTKSGNIQYIYGGSTIVEDIDSSFSGVIPAINIDKDKIVFVTEAGMNKSEQLSLTMDGSKVKEWTIALKMSDGLVGSYSEDTVQRVKPGKKIKVDIKSLPSNSSNYSQLSIMMVNKNNTVVAYGKLADAVSVGTYEVTIPYDLGDGNYKIKIFAEDVNSSKGKYLTDYVSNMVNLDITVDSSESSIIEKLQEEKGLHHEIDAVLYNTDEYGASGEKGQKLTKEGITVDGWKHKDSKFLKLDVKLHDTDEECHVVSIKLPKEMYFVGDIKALPAGCTDVNFKKNDDVPGNGGVINYVINSKSGVLKYYIAPHIREISIQLEFRYDNVLWDKRKGVSITSEDVIPVDISIDYEPNQGEVLDGGTLQEARISKIISGSSTNRVGWFVYESDRYDTSINNTKDLCLHIVESSNVVESLYFQEGIIEVHMPYWVDKNGIKHYLKYDVNTIEINKSFFCGDVIYEIVEQKESVIKFKVNNLYYATTLFAKIPLTYPGGIETEDLFIDFADGRLVVEAISVNGERFKNFEETITSVQYATRKEEFIQYSPSGKDVHNDKTKKGVTQMGGFYLENKGTGHSTEKYVNIQFPKELLITTINLPSDTISEKIKIKYKLIDENSEDVYLDDKGMRVSSDSENAKNEWEIEVDNNFCGATQLDNIYYCLYRDKLPEGHRRYYFKEISYTIGRIRASARLFVHAGVWSIGGAGNYMGYLGKDAVEGGFYTTNVSIKSPKESNIADINMSIITAVTEGYSVPYGIDSVGFSSNSINAGETVDVTGSVFVADFPYGNSQLLKNIRVGLVLKEGVTVDTNNIILYTQDKKVIDVVDVTKKDIGNDQTLWIIDAEPELYIGYASEDLKQISKGNRLNFSVRLKTSKRLESTTLFTDTMLYCAGKNVTNASGGSYYWTVNDDKWDLNENGSVTDFIGMSYYYIPATCNIIPSPPSLDIEDSLSIEGKGTIKKGIVYVGDEDDKVTYSLNIKSIDDGTASSFQYFIPVPKLATSRDSYLILSEKNKSFDFALTNKVTLSGDAIYVIDYCFEKGISYDEASQIGEEHWFSAEDVVNQKDGAWEDVTMVRLRAEGLIEKGIDSTIKMKLKYGGESFVKDAGQKNVWRSSGYYEFDTGARVVSGYFKSPGVSAVVDYTWEFKQNMAFVARANDGSKDNVAINTFPENKDDIDLSGFPGTNTVHTYQLTGIDTENVELKSKKFMQENKNTLSASEADKYFGITLVMKDDDGNIINEIDVSEGIKQEIGAVSGEKLPTFDIYMYYGSNFQDSGVERKVSLTIKSDKGITINIVGNIYYVSKNTIEVLNGEDNYSKGEDELVKLFYIYEMSEEILKGEEIEFKINKTNDSQESDFVVSKSKDFGDTDKYVSDEYIQLSDDKGNIIKPQDGTYKIKGDTKYILKLSEKYMLDLASGGTRLYLHSHVPSLSVNQEILILKRRLFAER